MAVGELKGLQRVLRSISRAQGGKSSLYLHTVVMMATVEERLSFKVWNVILYGMWYILAFGISTTYTIIEVLFVPGRGLDFLVRRLAILDGILVGAAGIVEPADDTLHWIPNHVYIYGLRQIKVAKVQPVNVPYVNGAFLQPRHKLGSFLLRLYIHLSHCIFMKTAALQYQTIVILHQGIKQFQ